MIIIIVETASRSHVMLTDTGDLDDISIVIKPIVWISSCFELCCCFFFIKFIPQSNWALNYPINRVYRAYYRHIQSYPYADRVLFQINSSFQFVLYKLKITHKKSYGRPTEFTFFFVFTWTQYGLYFFFLFTSLWNDALWFDKHSRVQYTNDEIGWMTFEVRMNFGGVVSVR